MDEPQNITVRIPGRMKDRWNALLTGGGFGKLEISIQDGKILFVRLEETFRVRARITVSQIVGLN